ncbi:HXXEE domain-containing protein [Nocardioides sp.]|uniref:HXXEE domain-containing protein n=1 Tax=Nocardioides sp. TaxID=35761 RepID=UPI003528FF7D
MTTPTTAPRTSPDRAWAATAALIGIHQVEEVVFSLGVWRDEVGDTGWAPLDRVLRHSPIASYSVGPRVATLAGQALVGTMLYAATRRSPGLTRAATSALSLGWGAAFVMHLTVATRTRSAMPGLATSILPGLPGVAVTLRYIWAGHRAG